MSSWMQSSKTPSPVVASTPTSKNLWPEGENNRGLFNACCGDDAFSEHKRMTQHSWAGNWQSDAAVLCVCFCFFVFKNLVWTLRLFLDLCTLSGYITGGKICFLHRKQDLPFGGVITWKEGTQTICTHKPLQGYLDVISVNSGRLTEPQRKTGTGTRPQ